MTHARDLLRTRSLETVRGAWLPIQLTAVFLLLNIVQVWYLLGAMITLAGLGLIFQRLLRTPAYWVGVTLAFLVLVSRTWPLASNIYFLAGYWTLAIVIALCLPDPPSSLAVSARWLLALVFLWAALWKGVFSPDYRDGRFFSVILMTDIRFEEQTRLLSGLTLDDIHENHAYLLAEPAALGDPPMERMRSTPRFRLWVTIITWSILAYEAALGLAFLLPLGRRLSLLRHGAFLLFSIGTFAFAPVRTFGWLLLIFGLAQVDLESTRLRTVYLITWFLVAFVSYAPWAHVSGLAG